MIDERIAIGDPLGTGTARIDRLTLTGWSDRLRTWSKNGVMWAVVTSGAIYIYRRRKYDGTFASGDAVCALTTGLTDPHYGATLSAQNSSGISGTVDVSGTDCIRKVIVSFCDETDIATKVHKLSTALDSSSQFVGGTRFEKPLSDAFLWVAEEIEDKLRHNTTLNDNNRVDVTRIAEPSRFAVPQAWKAAEYILRAIHGPNAVAYQELADRYAENAAHSLKRIAVEIDDDDDEEIDVAVEPMQIRLSRG